jgi:hypothetical protein
MLHLCFFYALLVLHSCFTYVFSRFSLHLCSTYATIRIYSDSTQNRHIDSTTVIIIIYASWMWLSFSCFGSGALSQVGHPKGSSAYRRLPSAIAHQQKPNRTGREFVRNALLPLNKICVDPDASGWREIDPERVIELRDAFYRGEFGMTVTCDVQVMDAESTDNKKLVDDGLATCCALPRIAGSQS